MKMGRFLTALAISAMAVSMLSAMPASADTYTPVAGSDTTVYKYLVLDKNAEVPTASFSYTIAAGEAVENNGDNVHSLAAYAGIDADKVTVGSVSFAAGDTTVDGAGTDGITNSTDKKYASKSFKVDFKNVKFSEPGVYRYVLTEENAGEGANENLGAGIKHVGNYQKTLDVYVSDDNGTLNVASYVLYNKVVNTAPALATEAVALSPNVDRTADDSNKTDGFVNEYSSNTLTFGKKVAGNQGSRDKYFKYTITFLHAKDSNITIDESDSNYDKAPVKNNATVYEAAAMAAANSKDENATADGQQLAIASNNVVYEFYLHDGQYITLTGLPEGSDYMIEEDAEEYSSKTSEQQSFVIGDKTFSDKTTGNVSNVAILAGFTNTKDGTIPTGVILSIAAPAVVGIAVIGGLIVINAKKKKEDTED